VRSCHLRPRIGGLRRGPAGFGRATASPRPAAGASPTRPAVARHAASRGFLHLVDAFSEHVPVPLCPPLTP
jgi:hypothetical protein